MVSFSCDTSKVEKLLAKMDEQLDDFPKAMADELTAWQRDDMHRRYPNTAQDGDDTVYTLIWPTSRLSAIDEKQRRQDRRRGVAWLRRVRQPRPPAGTAGRVKSARPILRDALKDQLQDRMDKLMEDELSWA